MLGLNHTFDMNPDLRKKEKMILKKTFLSL